MTKMLSPADALRTVYDMRVVEGRQWSSDLRKRYDKSTCV
jgi:hypothetical protein